MITGGIPPVVAGSVVGMLPAASGGDDTAAIQAVINAGGYVRGVSGASYELSAALVPVAGLTLDMRGCTITMLNDNAPMVAANGVADVQVLGGVWNHTVLVSQSALSFVGCARPVVRGARVERATASQACVHMTDCTDGEISDNHLEGGQFGVWIDTSSTGSARIRVANNRAYNQSSVGIFLGNNVIGNANHVIDGNTVQNSGNIGIGAGSGSTEPTIVGNTIVNNTGNAIDFGDATGAVISGNTIDTALSGIGNDCSAHGSGNYECACAVTGNTINNTSAAAIYLAGNTGVPALNFLIAGNALRNCQQDGIRLSGIARGSVVANTIFEVPATFGGIRLGAAIQRSVIADNVIQGTGIGILFDAAYNGFAQTIAHNNLSGATTKVSGTPNAQDILRGNFGYNPLGHGVTQPSVPASTTAQTNTTGSDCTVYVTGGTVSAIAVGGVATGLTSGAFRVAAGQTITLTYSAAPTWAWFGD